MKKITILLVNILIVVSAFAQSPNKMSYQAVIRDANNNLVGNKVVGMQISILQGFANGTAVYIERQKPTTNANGLVSIELGTGVSFRGIFSNINWSNGPYYVKTEVDPSGSSNYSITTTSQMLSVPYSLYANVAGSLVGGVTESDPVYSSSAASGITNSDIESWNDKSDETDPIYSSERQYLKIGVDSWVGSLAKNIDSADTARWGRDEIDPVFSKSLAYNISTADTMRWGYNKWNVSGNNLYYSNGKVGVGISSPENIGSAPLNVEGGILYKGGVTGGASPGKLFYDSAGDGNFKYYDNNNTEKVLGAGSISYSGSLWRSTSGDFLSYNDVICQGSLAVGFDAVAGENFGYSTILLKENNLRIRFDDTSNSGSFPSNDWQLTANDAASGGANYFAIEDITGATVPFKVMAGAPTSSIEISASGNVGIGTKTPSQKLDIQGAMHLEPTTEPTSPSEGDLYFDSTTKKLRCYDGTTWHDLW